MYLLIRTPPLQEDYAFLSRRHGCCIITSHECIRIHASSFYPDLNFLSGRKSAINPHPYCVESLLDIQEYSSRRHVIVEIKDGMILQPRILKFYCNLLSSQTDLHFNFSVCCWTLFKTIFSYCLPVVDRGHFGLYFGLYFGPCF